MPRGRDRMRLSATELADFADAPLRARLEAHLLSRDGALAIPKRTWLSIAQKSDRLDVLTKAAHVGTNQHTSGDDLNALLSKFSELGAPVPPEFKWAKRKADRSAKRRLIFAVLGGFVAFSIIFGTVVGIRRSMQRERSGRPTARVAARFLLFLIVLAELELSRTARPGETSTVLAMALAAGCVWAGGPRIISPRMRTAVTSLCLVAACSMANGTWAGGGDLSIAWATWLWPLALITLGVSFEVYLWRMGLFRWTPAVLFASFLLLAFGDPLLCGTILVLENLGLAPAAQAADWMEETRRVSWLTQAAVAIRSSPINALLFHLFWWGLFPRYAKLLAGSETAE